MFFKTSWSELKKTDRNQTQFRMPLKSKYTLTTYFVSGIFQYFIVCLKYTVYKTFPSCSKNLTYCTSYCLCGMTGTAEYVEKYNLPNLLY